MKRFPGMLILIVSMIFTGHSVIAQNVKFAHINSDDLIRALPDYDSAMAKLQRTQTELQNTLELMQVELNNKYDTYTKTESTLTDLVRQSKQQEIQDLQRRIQNFTTQAQTTLQDEQVKLTQPIFDKIDKAIKDVGKEGGFIYVFDVAQSKGQVLYFDPAKSTDILPQVKTKLGVQ